MSNLLTIKKADKKGVYKTLRTLWIGDAEAEILKKYFVYNQEVPGYYVYSLVMNDAERTTHTWYYCHSDLIGFAKYKLKQSKRVVYNTYDEENINVIEQ